MKLTKEIVALAEDGTEFRGKDAQQRCRIYEKTEMQDKLFDKRFCELLANAELHPKTVTLWVPAVKAVLNDAKKGKELIKLLQGYKPGKAAVKHKTAKAEKTKPQEQAPKVKAAKPLEQTAPDYGSKPYVIAKYRDDKGKVLTWHHGLGTPNTDTSIIHNLIPDSVKKTINDLQIKHQGRGTVLALPTKN